MHDEEFVFETISDGNVDLETSPASKVRQLAKRMESSKATAKHIKQVAGDPQFVQSNFMGYQHTELSSGKHKKKKPFIKSRQPSPRIMIMKINESQVIMRRVFTLRLCIITRMDAQSVEI